MMTSDERAVDISDDDHTVVLAGGVGAARMLRAMHLWNPTMPLTAIVNTGDDAVINGLVVSPDIDTVIYTLAGAIDPTRGWGLRDETFTSMAALARYTTQRPTYSTAPNDWFNLGDRDLATHLYRTARTAEGATPSEVTTEIARAWGVTCRVVPMTDATVATRVTLSEDALLDGRVAYRAGDTVSFQEYFVRLRHSVAVRSLEFAGAAAARPNGVDMLQRARHIVIAPSNPLVSIAPIRALHGIDDVLSARRADVVAVSPIIGGAALKGPADRMMRELGHEATALGVARLYAEVCGTLVIDNTDAALADDIERLGVRCVVTNTIMSTDDAARNLARTTLAASSAVDVRVTR